MAKAANHRCVMSEGSFFVIGDIKGKGHKVQQAVIRALAHGKQLFQPKVLYIGAASENNPHYESGFISGIKAVFPGSSVTPLRFSMAQPNSDFDSCSKEVAPEFEKADIIYFEAGDIAPLKAVFDRFKLKSLCKRAYERGALVGGLCGGGSFMADQVVHYDVQSGDFTRDLGASLWAGSAISCHMDREDEYSQRHQQLKNVASSGMMRAIGLGANQAVVFDESGEYALCPTAMVDAAKSPFYVDRNGSNCPIPVRCI